MGAVNFSNLVVLKGGSREAYREACEEMRDYNGHQEGYSGDIQTVDGFRMVSNFPRFGTKAFSKWEEKRLENLDKRECECIEITSPPALRRLKERNGFKGKKGVKAFYFYGIGAC